MFPHIPPRVPLPYLQMGPRLCFGQVLLHSSSLKWRIIWPLRQLVLHLGIYDFEFECRLPGYYEVIHLLVLWFVTIIRQRSVDKIMHIFVFGLLPELVGAVLG